MRFRSLTAPGVLVLLQTTPISVQHDSSGRLQLAVGWGAGQFEQRQLSCAGDVLSADPVPFSAGGVQLDYRPAGNVRLSGFVGVVTAGEHRSGWGGFQTAIEGGGAGLGVGLAGMPFEDFRTVPSGYLRVGGRDGTHFRFDINHPTPVVGTTGDVFRIGAGFNQGLRRAPRGFFGVSVGPYSDESHIGGFFGELDMPIVSHIDLSVAGSWRPSAAFFDGGARVAVRYHLGR